MTIQKHKCSFQLNSQKLETLLIFINIWMEKQSWHIYIIKYYPAIKKNIVTCTKVNLEIIILHEKSKSKRQYTILFHICRIVVI